MKPAKDILGIQGPRKNQSKTILGPRNPRSQIETDAIADKLVSMFNSPKHRPLFLKAAWRISESRLMQIAEKALTSGYTSPRAYFITAVKRDKEYYS